LFWSTLIEPISNIPSEVKYFPNKFKTVVHTNQATHEGEGSIKESQICLDLGATAFIDDNLDYCMDCTSNRIESYLYDRPWKETNDHPKNISRVFSWEDLTQKLANL